MNQELNNTNTTNTPSSETNSNVESCPKKKINLKTVSLILFILNIFLIFIPFVGLLVTATTIVTTILMIRKTEKKTKRRKLLIVRLCIAIIILLPISLLMCSVTSVNSAAEQAVLDDIKSRYDQYEYNYSDLNAELTDESNNIYTVTGKVWFWAHDYSELLIKAIYIQVNYVISYDEDEGEFTLISQSREIHSDESQNKKMEYAIDVINEKKAVEAAEKAFKETLKSPTSYIRHDYAISASYEENGDITVIVKLDFSAENSYGAMIRSKYLVTLKYSNGNYEYLYSKEV